MALRRVSRKPGKVEGSSALILQHSGLFSKVIKGPVVNYTNLLYAAAIVFTLIGSNMQPRFDTCKTKISFLYHTNMWFPVDTTSLPSNMLPRGTGFPLRFAETWVDRPAPEVGLRPAKTPRRKNPKPQP